MRIRRLTAVFGKLENDTLVLSPGLNIIEAPNESGKSTWCAFIRAMFFGLNTTDRDKQGYLSDKTRYRPWSGLPMAGSIDLSFAGQELTIQRKSGKQPMKDFSAVYTDTGVAAPFLYPETAGEILFGADSTIVERSAFITQTGMKFGQTPQLEKRISALVSTGDEALSYTEADDRLRQWLRKRRFNKSGTIPTLEDHLQTVTQRLSDIDADTSRTADLRLEAQRQQRQAADLKARLVESHTQEATLQGLRGSLLALEPLRESLAKERQRVAAAEEYYNALLLKKAASPFRESGPEHLVRQARTLEHRIGGPLLGSVVALALLLLISASLALTIFLPTGRLIAGLAAAVLLSALLVRTMVKAKAKRRLKRLLQGYGAANTAALKELQDKDLQLREELVQAESRRSAAIAAYDSVLHTLSATQQKLGLSEDGHTNDMDLSSLQAQLTKAAVREPVQSSADLSKALDEVTQNLELLNRQYNMALGEIRALGDPVVLQTEKNLLEESLASQKMQLDALTMAIEGLGQASTELQTRFSPLLSNTAGAILQKLTAGRYDKLNFTKALEAEAKPNDSPVSHSTLSLSEGTADQIYLALRLAIAELLLSGQDPCPLILDDALSSFDDDRAKLALQYLSTLAAKRQVLLFTCHKRDAELLRGMPNVTVLKLR